jgi:hypothetical protein
VITVDSLKQKLIADTSITDQLEHCGCMPRHSGGNVRQDQYLHLGKGAPRMTRSFRRF